MEALTCEKWETRGLPFVTFFAKPLVVVLNKNCHKKRTLWGKKQQSPKHRLSLAEELVSLSSSKETGGKALGNLIATFGQEGWN